jgi:hypothetical protein
LFSLIEMRDVYYLACVGLFSEVTVVLESDGECFERQPLNFPFVSALFLATRVLRACACVTMCSS